MGQKGNGAMGQMPELRLDREVRRRIAQLDADVRRQELAAAVHDVLDLLEPDPLAGAVRRRRVQSPPLWHVRIETGAHPWALLWEPHPSGADVVLVHYLGPASFAGLG